MAVAVSVSITGSLRRLHSDPVIGRLRGGVLVLAALTTGSRSYDESASIEIARNVAFNIFQRPILRYPEISPTYTNENVSEFENLEHRYIRATRSLWSRITRFSYRY
jgi:hypothetical protein